MISVVIPLYNKAHTIKRTLGSVISQIYQDFEVIVVDDGSTDNGIEIVREFDDSRIKIIEQENQGVSSARNNGVAISRYDYIAFLDGDDEWKNTYLKMVYKTILKYKNAGMICTAGFIKDNKTGEIWQRLAKKYSGKIQKIDYFENPHVFTHTSSTVVAKKVFNKIKGGFPVGMRKNQDLALFFSVALICDTVYIGFPLSYYYGNVDFQTTQRLKNDFSYTSKRINKTYNLWKSLNKKNKKFLIFLKYEIRHIILNFIRNSDYNNLQLLLDDLDIEVLNHFPRLELYLYKRRHFKKLAIYYILTTKIIWRMKKFPRVGE